MPFILHAFKVMFRISFVVFVHIKKMSKILINYADNRYYEAQKMNCTTGISIGGFDKVIPYDRSDLDPIFVAKNSGILNQSRGAGYWIWKPYLILKTLRESKENDIIFYCDSGSYFIHSMDPIFKLVEKHGIISFDVGEGHLEKTWTKRDIFITLDCDTDAYKNTRIRVGGFVALKNNSANIEFVTKYLHYAEMAQLITDAPSKLGPNDPMFRENRHDQSIYSVLSKKYKIPSFPDPSQFGDKERDGNYPTLIYLHRHSGTLPPSEINKIHRQRVNDVILSPFSGTQEERRAIAQQLRARKVTVIDDISVDQNLDNEIAYSKVLVSISPFHDQGVFLALNKQVCVVRVRSSLLFDEFYSGLTIVTPRDQLIDTIVSTVRTKQWKTMMETKIYEQDFQCLDVLDERFYAFCCDWTDTQIQP